MNKLLNLMFLFIFVLSISGLNSDTERINKGKEILLEQDRRTKGFHDSTVKAKMILKNSYGQKSVRNLRFISMETKNGHKGLIIFDSPTDIEGTKLLTHTKRGKDDKQWIYLPYLKRIKRIASKNKSGSFMGSELSYEDLTYYEVADYDYEYLREEKHNNQMCYVIKRIIKDKDSGYTSHILWIDQKEYLTLKIDYYDRKKALMKTLLSFDYILYNNKYWRQSYSVMKNHQTGKSTEMINNNFKFKTGLTDQNFSRRNLAWDI